VSEHEHPGTPGAGHGHDPQPAGPTGTQPQQDAAAPAAGSPFQPAPGGPAPAQGPHAPTFPWATPHAPNGTGYPGYGGYPPFGGPTTTLTGTPTAPPATRRTPRWRVGIAGLVAGALIGGGAGAGVVTLLDEPTSSTGPTASAQNVVIKNPQSATTATAAAAKAAPSVVTIYVTSGSNAGSGSGVVLTDDGYVLTNNHVVTLEGNGTGTVQVRLSDGRLLDASVVGTDPSSDLAVVKVDGVTGLKPATFADSDKVQVGDVAVAIGAPLGLSNTVTDGIVSATQRAVSTGSTQNDATVLDAIQTDAAINPGNSGGALVNAAGEVMGINTAIASVASGAPGDQSQSGNIGVGFAIPSNTAARIADELMKTGKASRALLGVSARTAADGNNPELGTGAEVVSVQPDSAAAQAGIQAGDVVTAVAKRPVTTSAELTAAVRSYAPGAKVVLSIRRGNSTTTVEVTLGKTS
jgi:putative serine protease PepD